MDNGNYVTRAELKAHLEPMRSDISQMSDDLREVRDALIGENAVKRVVKDSGARRMSLAMLVLYLVSATVAILAYIHTA